MEEAFFPFETLPYDIILEIFSRIPMKAVLTCKCVCKTWLDLLKTREFAQSHLSKSSPGLVVHHTIRTESHNSFDTPTCVFKISEFHDSSRELSFGASLEQKSRGDKPNSSRTEMRDRNSFYGRICSSIDGLLFLRTSKTLPSDYYVCNPITREYVMLPRPLGAYQFIDKVIPCGFGASRSSKQYKVVTIFEEPLDERWNAHKSFAQVYALGKESWASTAAPWGLFFDLRYCSVGTFLEGNLHWLTRVSWDSWGISCFDLETETFTHFEAPGKRYSSIGVLRGRLCLCENSSNNEVTIYLMTTSDFGEKTKCWSVEYVIRDFPVYFDWWSDHMAVNFVMGFENGDLLLSWDNEALFCYSKCDKKVARLEGFTVYGIGIFEAVSYTPSLVSLMDLERKNVIWLF